MFIPTEIRKYNSRTEPRHILRRCWNPGYLEDASLNFYNKKRYIKQIKSLSLLFKVTEQNKRIDEYKSIVYRDMGLRDRYLIMKIDRYIGKKVCNYKGLNNITETKMNAMIMEGDSNVAPFLNRL